MLKIVIASDHAGFEYKNSIIRHFAKKYVFVDLGPENADSVDYPDYASGVATALQTKQADFGILLCGTGIGMSIAANKFKGIRAALCHTPEEASITREHNNANILVMGARTNELDNVYDMMEAFLSTGFSGDDRHVRRIDKITQIEIRQNDN